MNDSVIKWICIIIIAICGIIQWAMLIKRIIDDQKFIKELKRIRAIREGKNAERDQDH